MYRFRSIKTRYLTAFIKSRLMVGRIIQTLDLDQFMKYKELYGEVDPAPGYSKYLDIRPWMAEKLMTYFILGLHKSKPLNILDLGTGPGYFPYICSIYGHKSAALDLDEVPMYNDLCSFFRIDRNIGRIEKFQPLPDFGRKFDLITALAIKFNRHNEPDQWGVAEWKFMLDDLKKNQLSENGRIFMHFNANLDGSFLDNELLSYFHSIGAQTYLYQVDIGGPKRAILSRYLDRLFS